MVYFMTQGDKYFITFSIVDDDGNPVPPSGLENVSMTIGNITKTLADGAIGWDSENEVYTYPLTQAESILMENKPYPVQVRIKNSQGIKAFDCGEIFVNLLLDKEVM